MSDYWLGVLTIPVIILTLAVAIAAFAGSWLLLEKWSRGRLVKVGPVRMPERVGKLKINSLAHLGGREIIAGMALTLKTVHLLRITPNFGIAFMRGASPHDADTRRILFKAIPTAVGILHEATEEKECA